MADSAKTSLCLEMVETSEMVDYGVAEEGRVAEDNPRLRGLKDELGLLNLPMDDPHTYAIIASLSNSFAPMIMNTIVNPRRYATFPSKPMGVAVPDRTPLRKIIA